MKLVYELIKTPGELIQHGTAITGKALNQESEALPLSCACFYLRSKGAASQLGDSEYLILKSFVA